MPRLAAIGRYVTPDELIWVFRSVQFREALLRGEWLNTLTAGHPGVTTTWLGALGISLQLGLRPSDTAVYTWITQLAWFAPENIPMLQNLALFLTSGRLLVALANSLGVVVIFLLARRLVGAAVALFVLLLVGPVPTALLGFAAVGLFFVGVWAAGVAEKAYGHDAGKINIDEVVGMLCAVLFLPQTTWTLLAAFFLFRLFDVLKPFPANRSQALPRGWGVMADDVIAGVYANLVVQVGLRLLS